MHHIYVRLTPGWDGIKIPDLGVKIKTDIPAKQGKKLFSINRLTVIKPFTELLEPFQLRDIDGSIPLDEQDSEIPKVKHGDYYPLRNSFGECELSYKLRLSPVGNNPVFDLGYEDGGMTGAGMTFMPSFDTDEEIEYEMDWDLQALPKRAVGVWSFGEGHVVQNGGKDLLQDTFYAAGMMDSVRLANFSYYWWQNDIIAATALSTARIFLYESKFFGDQGQPYTIFTRHAPELNIDRAGGTALTRAYMYIYKDDSMLDQSWLKFLFAHEMVHNWVHLNDTPFGTCTWYVEGMAEFYSAALPLRMGVVTPEELAYELNKRSRQYYENPAIHETNESCGEGLFSDPEKTRVPYGRGFFYLTHAVWMIRNASNGRHSLDDVVLELNARFEVDRELRNEAWIEVYGKYVGVETAQKEFEFIRKGGVSEPEVACYDGLIRKEKGQGFVRGRNEICDLWIFSAAENE